MGMQHQVNHFGSVLNKKNSNPNSTPNANYIGRLISHTAMMENSKNILFLIILFKSIPEIQHLRNFKVKHLKHFKRKTHCQTFINSQSTELTAIVIPFRENVG